MSIKAMKQALDALTYIYTETTEHEEKVMNEAITVLEQAIADAEKQEPVVGTKTWFEDGKLVTRHLHPSDIYASDISQERVDETVKDRHEWVGLTNEEINEFAAGCHLGNSVQGAIYKAAARLKEKNA